MTDALTVLVAIDPLMYRQVIAHCIRKYRPRVEVRMLGPDKLDGELGRLAPDLIVCNRATAVVRASAHSWVELQVRRGAGNLGANVQVDSRPMSRVEQAELDHILAALDETEKTLGRT